MSCRRVGGICPQARLWCRSYPCSGRFNRPRPPPFPEAESEGWATRKIKSKIGRSLRLGHPPAAIIVSGTFLAPRHRVASIFTPFQYDPQVHDLASKTPLARAGTFCAPSIKEVNTVHDGEDQKRRQQNTDKQYGVRNPHERTGKPSQDYHAH